MNQYPPSDAQVLKLSLLTMPAQTSAKRRAREIAEERWGLRSAGKEKATPIAESGFGEVMPINRPLTIRSFR
jgi:hypothetical protein